MVRAMEGINRRGDPKLAKRILAAMDIYSGKPQTQIALEVGVSPQAVTRWRKLGYLNKERIPAFCRACGVSIEWFLTGQGDPQGTNPFANLSSDEIIQAAKDHLTTEEQARLLQGLLSLFSKGLDAP